MSKVDYYIRPIPGRINIEADIPLIITNWATNSKTLIRARNTMWLEGWTPSHPSSGNVKNMATEPQYGHSIIGGNFPELNFILLVDILCQFVSAGKSVGWMRPPKDWQLFH